MPADSAHCASQMQYADDQFASLVFSSSIVGYWKVKLRREKSCYVCRFVLVSGFCTQTVVQGLILSLPSVAPVRTA